MEKVAKKTKAAPHPPFGHILQEEKGKGKNLLVADIFSKGKIRGVPVPQPAGCGGKYN